MDLTNISDVRGEISASAAVVGRTGRKLLRFPGMEYCEMYCECKTIDGISFYCGCNQTQEEFDEYCRRVMADIEERQNRSGLLDAPAPSVNTDMEIDRVAPAEDPPFSEPLRAGTTFGPDDRIAGADLEPMAAGAMASEQEYDFPVGIDTGFGFQVDDAELGDALECSTDPLERLVQSTKESSREPGQRRERLPRSAKAATGVSINDYILPQDGFQTALCFADLDTAFELDMLKEQLKGDYSDICTKAVAVYINQLLNSESAFRQIERVFGNGRCVKGNGTQVKYSTNAGGECANGLFSTRRFERGEPVAYYSGVFLPIREDKDTEVIPSDRKIVADVEITDSYGQVTRMECLLIGWESGEITNNFPLANGHMLNHSCVSNCVFRMVKLEFRDEGTTVNVWLPFVFVREDLPPDEFVMLGEEFTVDYGQEICMLSPFYKDEYQEAISLAQLTPDPVRQKEILNGVPRQFKDGEVSRFMKGATEIDCSCAECLFAAGPWFDEPFVSSILNLGPNDKDTTNLRNHYRIASRPRDCRQAASGPAVYTRGGKSIISSARSSGGIAASPSKVQKSHLSPADSVGVGASMGPPRPLKSPNKATKNPASLSAASCLKPSHEACDGGLLVTSSSHPSQSRRMAVPSQGPGSQRSESRQGYTNVSQRKGFYCNNNYMPYALVVHATPGLSPEEQKRRWKSDRDEHDRRTAAAKKDHSLVSGPRRLSIHTESTAIVAAIVIEPSGAGNSGGVRGENIGGISDGNIGGSSTYAARLLDFTRNHPDPMGSINSILHPAPPPPPD